MDKHRKQENRSKRIVEFKREYINKAACIFACLHFVVSFFTDRLIFTYVPTDFSEPLMIVKSLIAWGCKLFFGLVLLVFYHYIFYLFTKAPREYVKLVGIYFGIMVVLLLLTYPGIWRMDEFGLLFTAQEVFFDFWQNYLTDLFYIMALMFCPLPADIVLMQCLIISILVGNMLYRIKTLGLVRGKGIYALYLPFLCLPVLDSNLYPMRMSLYVYLELYMLVMLVLLHIEAQRGRELTCADFVPLLFTVPFVISLRTEAVYYFAAFPICFAALFWGKLPRTLMRRVLCGILAITLILYIPQQIGSRLRNGNEYMLTSIVLPIVPLVHAADEELAALSEGGTRYAAAAEESKAAAESVTPSIEMRDEQVEKAEMLETLLADIDRVINVRATLDGYAQGKNGIAMYWSDAEFKREGYTDEEFRRFQKAYHKLVRIYPDVFLKERMQTFLESGDLLQNTTEIYEDQGVPNHERFAAIPGNQAINTHVRNHVICFLELRRQGDYNTKLALYPVVYHVMLPLIFLVSMLVVLLLRKKWGYALLLASHLCKIPLIFLTAPSRLFMYYYPVYLVGVFVLVFVVLVGCSKKTGHAPA